MFAAVTLDGSHSDIMVCPWAGGVLNWTDASLRFTDKVNFPGGHSLPEKQLRMVSYLFELGYELCLAPAYNVSESPGFETPHGVFGGVE